MLATLTVSAWRFNTIFYKKKEKKRYGQKQSQIKLKIQYKCIKANTSAIRQHICCTYHQVQYSSPNRSNKQNKNDKSLTKEFD